MDFYEILQEIMSERSLTIPDVARATNLSDSTIRSIIARKNSTVALEVAGKISNGLGVSLELLNGSVSSETKSHCDSNLTSLTPTEKTLLANYNELNEEGKEKLFDYSEDLLSAGKYKKHNVSKMANETTA